MVHPGCTPPYGTLWSYTTREVHPGYIPRGYTLGMVHLPVHPGYGTLLYTLVYTTPTHPGYTRPPTTPGYTVTTRRGAG